VVWPHLPADPVTLEQEPGSDHVDCANNDGERRWIFEPLFVVDVLTPEGRNREGAVFQPEPLFDLRVAVDEAPQLRGGLRGLIHYGAPVHHVDQSSGQRRAVRPRDEP